MYKDGGILMQIFFIKKKSTSDHDADDHNGGSLDEVLLRGVGVKNTLHRLIFDHAG